MQMETRGKPSKGSGPVYELRQAMGFERDQKGFAKKVGLSWTSIKRAEGEGRLPKLEAHRRIIERLCKRHSIPTHPQPGQEE